MKCIQCGTDNNLKDRTANFGRCKNCRHLFVFEPNTMGTAKVTDPMFEKAIQDLSANGTLFFTPKQFFYFLDQRVKRKNSGAQLLVIPYIFMIFVTIMVGAGMAEGIGIRLVQFIPPSIVTAMFVAVLYSVSRDDKTTIRQRKACFKSLTMIGIVTLVWSVIVFTINGSYVGFGIALLLGILSTVLGTQKRFQIKHHQLFLFGPDLFQDWLVRWQQFNDPIAKLLPPPREDSAPAPVSADVTAYSFDRLVVCDSSAIAQMLIANNFHFENNCAILSVTGYPQGVFNTAMEMLRRNPDLKVYALHDCSPQGMRLVHHLRSTPTWFPDSSVAIIDIGLSPSQVVGRDDLFIRNTAESQHEAQQMSAEMRQSLSPADIAWLEAGNFVELESFSPKRLIQVLNRGLAGSQDLGNDTDGGIIFLGDSSGYYATDSFG